jgi:hypothetical protein
MVLLRGVLYMSEWAYIRIIEGLVILILLIILGILIA